jgi:hypothetical protein
MTAHELIGAWRLAEFKRRNGHGDIDDSYSHIMHGLIIYSADGHMSATICMNAQRFHADQPVTGTDAEKIAAFDAYTAYCGRYSVEGDTVFHDVEMSLFPNWRGTRQLRMARLAGSELVLTSPPMLDGDGEWILEAKWRRA